MPNPHTVSEVRRRILLLHLAEAYSRGRMPAADHVAGLQR